MKFALFIVINCLFALLILPNRCISQEAGALSSKKANAAIRDYESQIEKLKREHSKQREKADAACVKKENKLRSELISELTDTMKSAAADVDLDEVAAVTEKIKSINQEPLISETLTNSSTSGGFETPPFPKKLPLSLQGKWWGTWSKTREVFSIDVKSRSAVFSDATLLFEGSRMVGFSNSDYSKSCYELIPYYEDLILIRWKQKLGPAYNKRTPEDVAIMVRRKSNDKSGVLVK